MIDAVGVADQRIGEAAELDEPMPIGVVARQARDLEAKHEADVGEGDFGGEPGETRSRDKAGAGEPEILIDDDDAIGGPAELTGSGGERILSIGRLAIVLDLGGAGLAQVDDGHAGKVTGGDLLGESFGFLGFDFRRVRSLRGVRRAHYTPKLKKRTALLRKLKDVFRRHQPSEPVDLRARNRKDFGWRQWSRGWMYQTLKLFNGYRVVRPTPKAAPAG